MELSERFIKIFEDEGFTYVYEAQDKPGAIQKEHSHSDKVSVYITDGSLIFDFEGEKKEVQQNERFDIPPEKNHSVIAAPEGAIYIIGEMVDEG